MKKINHLLQLSVLVTSFFSCRNESNNATNPRENTVVVNKIDHKKKIAIDSFTFMTDYKDEIYFDSIIILGSKQIRVLHSTTNTYLLPKKYNTEDEEAAKLINYTKTEIFNNTANLPFKLDKKVINAALPNLDKQLKEFGVLLITAGSVKINVDSMILIYSYSIPFTDLGQPIIATVNLNNYGHTIKIR